mmetsp:Transcript_46583/g.123667  ORF Transcript_46583/g.123667 Transcript_46583/m.123667 type:complete len:327 (+) Transcript_46583:73-1053(+)
MTDTSSNVHVDEAPSSDRTSADGVSAGFTTNPEAPLLRRQTTRFQRLSSGPAHQVRANVVTDARATYISALCAIMLRVVELTLVGAVLAHTWNRFCDRPLHLYLFVAVALQCASTGVSLLCRPSDPDSANRECGIRLERLLGTAVMCWFVCGNVWVFGSRVCDATLHNAAAALIYLTYACIFLPLALLLLVVFCLPCIALCLPFLLRFVPVPQAVPAASNEQISSLTERVFRTGDYATEDQSCCICLDDYTPGDSLRVLPCDHHFHKRCLDTWLRTSAVRPVPRHVTLLLTNNLQVCPLCKRELFSSSSDLEAGPPQPQPHLQAVT